MMGAPGAESDFEEALSLAKAQGAASWQRRIELSLLEQS
jgi:hypothetical protein